MIVALRHEIEIDTHPERVYAFFLNIEQNYTKWHPDHIVFRWVKGNTIQQGAVAYSEQRVHGKIHKMSATFTKVIPNQLVEFRWDNLLARFFAPRNVWIFQPTNGGCRFIAESDLRLGWISSRMKHAKKALEAGRIHLKEEGENLKRLVEKLDTA
jgi:uncharacterized protein YndB with AHSA1/START domain